jgi:hypoxanthine-guanine phosphoribosyltransferase
MDNDLVQSDQQKKIAEQLIKKKYQAWKLLVIGVLLGFAIYSFGQLYRSLRTYAEVSNVK